jgi:hypothetical protein
MPLLWIGETFGALGFTVHAKRYLMLTLCEDAITWEGKVPAENTGVYFRLVWYLGLSDMELKRYASELWELSKTGDNWHPEALLQHLDTRWVTGVPSQAEAQYYVVNGHYVDALINKLGTDAGQTLENLATYLLSCMPGCRTTKRLRSWSTDYDVVCTMEGFDLDFRSELGRYFVCECKDWNAPADFSTMAKFCRVLDSTKARFGILFTKNGITGTKRTTDAAREQMKIYQDRGTVIVTIDQTDLAAVSEGANFVSLLRDRYEIVRLDLRGAPILCSL